MPEQARYALGSTIAQSSHKRKVPLSQAGRIAEAAGKRVDTWVRAVRLKTVVQSLPDAILKSRAALLGLCKFYLPLDAISHCRPQAQSVTESKPSERKSQDMRTSFEIFSRLKDVSSAAKRTNPI